MTTHRLDLFSLLSGLVLTGIALVGLFGVPDGLAAWVGPSILIGLGVLVLGVTVARSASRVDQPDVADHDPDRELALAAARDEVEEVEVTDV